MFNLSCCAESTDLLRILAHPLSQGAINGDKVILSVVAEGPADDAQLSYEWLKDDVLIADKAAANSSIFTIEMFSPEHVGSYQCIVSCDSEGSVDIAVSNKATLRGKPMRCWITVSTITDSLCYFYPLSIICGAGSS